MVAKNPVGVSIYMAPLVVIRGLYPCLRARAHDRSLAVRNSALEAGLQERVEEVPPTDGASEVRLTRETYRTLSVLLAIGRRGTSRKLGVSGEDRPKIVLRLIDRDGELEQFANDAAAVCAGGIQPARFSKEIGIDVETQHGTR